MTAVANLNRYSRRKEKTRQDLLAAAKRVLADKGYHNTKIADIAFAADIGVGTFYLYYPTKEALFLELVEDTARLLREEIGQARAAIDDPLEKTRITHLTFFRFAQTNRDLLKIIFGHGNTFNALLQQVYAGFITATTERITEGIKKNAFRPFPPQVIANASVGMFAQVVSWWIDQETPSAEEMAAIMTDFFLHGICQSPKPHS
jgi:AcrR family transcriptional regulator